MSHLKTGHDSQSVLSPLCSNCLAESCNLADGSLRNAAVSESVGRTGDLSLAGDGDLAMVMVDSLSAL